MNKEIYIGTSGYHYKHWKKIFYPEKLAVSSWFEYYQNYFSTVELNVTFYRLPSEKALETWTKNSKNEFIFAVKGSRYITHTKKLINVDDSVNLFFNRIKPLKRKIGVILWQFSESYKVNLDKFEKFLLILDKYKYLNAFEFRNVSWFQEKVYGLLKEHRAALVWADSPAKKPQEIVTSDFLYIRFHGSKKLYSSNYSIKEIEDWAKKINNLKRVRKVFIYFNNDAFGFAVKNGQYLKKLLEK